MILALGISCQGKARFVDFQVIHCSDGCPWTSVHLGINGSRFAHLLRGSWQRTWPGKSVSGLFSQSLFFLKQYPVQAYNLRGRLQRYYRRNPPLQKAFMSADALLDRPSPHMMVRMIVPFRWRKYLATRDCPVCGAELCRLSWRTTMAMAGLVPQPGYVRFPIILWGTARDRLGCRLQLSPLLWDI